MTGVEPHELRVRQVVQIRACTSGDEDGVVLSPDELRLVLCASPDYLAPHTKLRTPADLAEHQLIAFGGVSTPSTWSFWSGRDEVRITFRSRLSVTWSPWLRRGDARAVLDVLGRP